MDRKMTYTLAKMIISNRDAYSQKEVHEAACWMLGLLSASKADIAEAAQALS